MSGDDDFVQALDTGTEQEAAIEPGQADPGVDTEPADSFEAGAPAVVTERVGKAKIPRTAATRKAMAEAMTKFAADKKASKEAGEDEGDFGPTDDEPAYVPPAKAVPAPAVEVAPAAEVAPAVAPPVIAAPPAPSLDPEVVKLKQSLAAELDKHRATTADLEKRRADFEAERSASGAVDEAEYLESPTKGYRKWREQMRGAPLTDEEFRQEAADFVTLTSSDVLGVKLPDEVRAKMDAALARKAMASYRTREQKQKDAEAKAAAARHAEETEKQEAARVEAEWKQAAVTLDGHFKATESVAKEYAFLAAEDSPGSIVVDVIQSAKRRDGTSLSWQEASKQANDYLKKQASSYYDKRKHLLSAAPVPGQVTTPPAAKKDVQGDPQVPKQVTRPSPAPVASSTPPVATRVTKPGSSWSNEAHRRETRRAFAPLFQKPDE